MQTIPEQISSATRAPIEAQLEFFGSIAMATVENTGKLALLQIEASRAAINQASTAWRQWLAGGAQNLLAPMPRAASSQGARADTAPPVQPPTLREAGAPARDHDKPGAGQADASTHAQPVVSSAHAAEPPAQRNPIAEAASQVVPDAPPGVPASAAPLNADAPVALPKVKPLEAAPPPPSHSHGISQRKGVPRK